MRPMVLRTHTSPVQIRSMMTRRAPLRIIAPGRVYRSGQRRHAYAMFHQIEGLVIDRDITWATSVDAGDLPQGFFERDDIVLRMRPSYFPFTEPSAEVDVGWSMTASGRRGSAAAKAGWRCWAAGWSTRG